MFLHTDDWQLLVVGCQGFPISLPPPHPLFKNDAKWLVMLDKITSQLTEMNAMYEPRIPEKSSEASLALNSPK